MFCEKCGVENNDEAKFCKNCGAKLSVEKNDSSKNGNINAIPITYKKIIFILIPIIVIAIIFLFVFLNKPHKSVDEFVSQIKNAKTVLDYPETATIDDMDTIKFGKYSNQNPSDYADIEWIVLEKQENKALLMSKYIIDNTNYLAGPNGAWVLSPLYQKLNQHFYDMAFSDEEKARILQTHIKDEFPTDNYVFILDIDELRYYSGANMNAQYSFSGMSNGVITQFNYKIGKKIKTNSTNFANSNNQLLNVNNNHVMAKNSYWVRGLSSQVSYCNQNDICTYTITPYSQVSENGFGVRPCIWVSLESKNDDKKANVWEGDYYIGTDGKRVKNTWVPYGDNWYYCGPNGAILKNQWIDNTYYVDNTGKMLKNTNTPDGYYVGDDGKYVQIDNISENKNDVSAKKNINDELLNKYLKCTEAYNEYEVGSVFYEAARSAIGYPKFDANGNLWVRKFDSNIPGSIYNIYYRNGVVENYSAGSSNGTVMNYALKNNVDISVEEFQNIANKFENMIDCYELLYGGNNNSKDLMDIAKMTIQRVDGEHAGEYFYRKMNDGSVVCGAFYSDNVKNIVDYDPSRVKVDKQFAYEFLPHGEVKVYLYSIVIDYIENHPLTDGQINYSLFDTPESVNIDKWQVAGSCVDSHYVEYFKLYKLKLLREPIGPLP